MPSVFGKENKKRELISRLPEIYIQLQREYQISAGDFPEVKAMQVLGTHYNVMSRGWRGTATLSGWLLCTHMGFMVQDTGECNECILLMVIRDNRFL